MNEHGFTKAVLRPLPANVHVQSMTMASLSQNGTPDRYIDLKRDLWVEFKYANTTGARKGLNIGAMLSESQKIWLGRRYAAGGNAVVIVGVPSDRTRGFVVETPDEWEGRVDTAYIVAHIKTAPELAAYILARVT